MLNNKEKTKVFERYEKKIREKGLVVVDKDEDRPWGGFFVIDEDQSQKFSDLFFDGINVQELKFSEKLSPKILIIKPNTKLSWQYHYRRCEIWRVVKGSVGVVISFTDEEGVMKVLNTGDQIKLVQGERHRLIGLEDWGVVAEIWQHTINDHPSDENDIVRVQDDFGR